MNNKKPKILIIDDSSYDRLLYKSLLGKSEYEFIEFTCANDFINACSSLLDIDLVILDGILPDRKCDEIVNVIIDQNIVNSNKILLCTGLNRSSDFFKNLPNDICYLNKEEMLTNFKNKALPLIRIS